MALVKHTYTVKTKLPNVPIEEGQLIFIYDKGELYFDNSPTSRKQITNLIWLNKDQEREDILAPLTQKFYYVKETNTFWQYTGEWEEVFNPTKFATKAQGDKADTALQALEIGNVTFVNTVEEARVNARNEGNRTILDMSLPKGDKGDSGDISFPLLEVDSATGELLLSNADGAVSFEVENSDLNVIYKSTQEKVNLGQIRYNFRGDYSPDETYNYLDWVIYQELSSVCTSREPITGIAPSDSSKWQLIVGAEALEEPIIETVESTTFKHLSKTKANQFVRFNMVQGDDKDNTEICICGRNLLNLNRFDFKDADASISQHYHKIVDNKIYIPKSDFGASYLIYDINLKSGTKVRLSYNVNLGGIATFEYITNTGMLSAAKGIQNLSRDIEGLKITLNTESLSDDNTVVIDGLMLEIIDDESTPYKYEPFIGDYLDTLTLRGSGLSSHKIVRNGLEYIFTRIGDIGIIPNIKKIYLPAFACYDGVTNVFSVNNHKFTFEHLSNKKTAEVIAQNELYQKYCNPNPNILMNADFKNYIVNQRSSITEFKKGTTKASAWSIDRWYIGGGEENTAVKVTDKGLELILPSDGVLNAMVLQQNLDVETQRQIANKQLTLSLDYKILQGTKALVDASFVVYSSERSATSIITSLASPSGYYDYNKYGETYLPSFLISFKGAPGDKVLIKEAKLEVGDMATPMVSIPYEVELAKIKRIYEVCAKPFIDVEVSGSSLKAYCFMDANKISKSNLTVTNSTSTTLYKRQGVAAGTALPATYVSSITFPNDYAKGQPTVLFTDANGASGVDQNKPIKYYFIGEGMIINGERQL